MMLTLILTLSAVSFDGAVELYGQGEIEAACAAFHELRLTAKLSDPTYPTLLKHVGVCRFVEGDTPGAGAIFNALLEIDPQARLSTDDFPPAAVEYFERTRARHAFQRRPVVPPAAPRIDASPYTPFGAHQFARGDDDLGQFLLVGQATGLAAGVCGLIAFETMKEDGAFLDYGRFRDPDAARLLHGVYLAGFVTFAALWIYGAYDGASYQPGVAPVAGGAVVGGSGRW